MSAIQQMLFGAGRPATGQAEYITPGTFTWVCPAGVTSVSAVCVGGGGAQGTYATAYWNGAGGGALAYANNIPVTPGNSYTIVVGAAGATMGANGGDSSFNATSAKAEGGKGGSSVAQLGGNGGAVLYGAGGAGGAGGACSVYGNPGGGGGAGGYAGTGGAGAAGGSGLNGGNGAGGGGAAEQDDHRLRIGLAQAFEEFDAGGAVEADLTKQKVGALFDV